MRKTFGDKLAAIVADVANSGGPTKKVRNAHDFITNKTYGLGMDLYPGQSVILKAHYGIPLDDVTKFDIKNYNGDLIGRFTEADLLKYWYDDIDRNTGFGRANIRTVEEDDERTMMILSLGRRSGKCLRDYSLIKTSKGVVRIDSLGDPNGPEYQPLEITVAQEGKNKRAKSAYFYNGGIKPTIGYRTRCGYELEGTSNHRVKVLSPEGTIEWKYLGDIQKDDVICIHRSTDLWSNSYVSTDFESNRSQARNITFPTIVDEKWGLLLGCLAGEGTWKSQVMVQMTIENSEFWEIMKNLYRELFQEEAKVYMIPETKSTGRLQIHSVDWRAFLHHLGWDWNCKRDTKKVPWSIMQSPKSVVAAFLRGLFETDGCAECHGREITFSTASKQLAFEVQILLLNFGIVSRRYAKKDIVTKKYYHNISLRGRKSKEIFAEEIGFLTKKKNFSLFENLKKDSATSGDTESIPFQKSYLRQKRNDLPIGTRTNFRNIVKNAVKSNCKENLTYNRIEKMKEAGVSTEHFDYLYETNYFFDPVVEMWEDEGPVYDLNVPDGAQFVSNGMTNHNTTLSASIVAYESYKLIKKINPQKYYGTTAGDMIQLASLATSREQAKLLFNGVTSHLNHCAFFRPYMANNTQQMVKLQTPQDIEIYGRYADNEKAKASIKVTFLSSNAAGIRGSGNLVCILDEVAFFPETGPGGAEEVYQAMGPSLAQYTQKDPNNPLTPIGPGEARMIMISSPAGKQGLFFKKFEQAMRGGAGAEHMLAIQAPTWEINGSVSTQIFLEKRSEDPRAFRQEFGSEFSDRTLGFLESEQDLLACVNKQARKRYRGQPRVQYFVGIDLAQVNDATAIAISHIDEGGKIVVDCVDRIQAGWGSFEEYSRLETEWIVEWIIDYYMNFSIIGGIADQHHAAVFMTPFERGGIKNFEFKKFSPSERTDMWKSFKSLMYDRRIVLYDLSEEDIERRRMIEEDVPSHEDYILEFLSLQQKNKSKNVFEVEAPYGRHDDMADAVVRSIYLASQHITSKKHIAGVHTGAVPVEQLRLNAAMKAKNMRRARMKARLGGSHPSRMIPPNLRRK